MSTKQASEIIRLSLNEFRKSNFVEALAYSEIALEINPKDFRALQIRPLCKCCIILESGAVDSVVEDTLQNVISDLKQSIECSDDMASKIRDLFGAIAKSTSNVT